MHIDKDKKIFRRDAFDVKEVLRLYSPKTPNDYTVSDNSRGQDDKRFIIFADYPNQGKVVLKAARNSFSTPKRVAVWAELAEHYNKRGIYAPRFLRCENGEYGVMCGSYCVWAEEFAKYTPDETVLDEASAKARLKALGRVAAVSAPLTPWSSPYAMFDKFCVLDEAPEIYENGLYIMREISGKFPQFASRAASIMKEYKRRRTAFEPIYRALPKAAFQADMNCSNLLFDAGKFAGLMDFNLSGTDAVLSYVFYESNYINFDEELAEVKRGALRIHALEERTRRNLAYVSEEYCFGDSERSAFNTFYNLAVPFWNYNFILYKDWLRECGGKAVPRILDYIEFHLTREDVGGWIP